MGKSYKKNPVIKSGGINSRKATKRASNKVLRRIKITDDNEELAVDGGLYKRHYQSWNIHDYVCRWTEEDAVTYYTNKIEEEKLNKRHVFSDMYPTLEEFLNWWKKIYRRK